MANEPKTKKDLKQDEQAREQRKYGKIVAQVRSQWGNQVNIYAKGYISIRGIFGTLETPEKLISIDFVDQIQLNPMTSLGRAKSRKISEGEIRDTYLIFVTDQRSDQLHWSDNNNSDNSQIMRLVAVARAAIAGSLTKEDRAGKSEGEKENPFQKSLKPKKDDEPAKSKSEKSLADELKELSLMHKAGDLSAEEFKLAKEKLLKDKD
ncbi:MAG: hypothetical protein RIQ88_392 [Actinomycetota bacterium]